MLYLVLKTTDAKSRWRSQAASKLRVGFLRSAFLRVGLVQSQRLDCRFVNCSSDFQPVIALEIRKSRSRVDDDGTHPKSSNAHFCCANLFSAGLLVFRASLTEVGALGRES